LLFALLFFISINLTRERTRKRKIMGELEAEMVPKIPNWWLPVSIRKEITSLRAKIDLNPLILLSSMGFLKNQNLK
jgi:hypothetical protein